MLMLMRTQVLALQVASGHLRTVCAACNSSLVNTTALCTTPSSVYCR